MPRTLSRAVPRHCRSRLVTPRPAPLTIAPTPTLFRTLFRRITGRTSCALALLTAPVLGAPQLAAGAPDPTAIGPAALETAYAAYQRNVERGDYDVAYPHAERALALSRQVYGPAAETTAILEVNLGDLDMLRSRFDVAKPHYESALATLEQLNGGLDVSLLIPLNDLARIHTQAGYFEQARTMHERSLRIVEAAYGPRHPAVANRLVTLGIFEELVHEPAAARARYEKSLELRRAIFPESHPDIAESLFFLAKLELQERAFERAATLYARAMEIWSETPPRDPKILLAAKSQLGYARRKLGATPAAVAAAPAHTAVSRGDSDAQPLFRAAPEYPRRALQRELEGFVRLSFRVTEQGRVVGAAVVEAEPAGIFDRAALDALEQWKYQPRIRAGQPVVQENMEVVLRFVLPKD